MHHFSHELEMDKKSRRLRFGIKGKDKRFQIMSSTLQEREKERLVYEIEQARDYNSIQFA